MHVIFIAPHFPANQRQFVRALKEIGWVVGSAESSISPISHVDGEVKGWLDDFEEVPSVTSYPAALQAVNGFNNVGLGFTT